MTEQSENSVDHLTPWWSRVEWLHGIGLASLGGYVAFAILSHRSGFGTAVLERPLLEIILLLFILFLLYLAALRVAIESKSKRVGWWTILFAVLFRLVTVMSEPFQEVDFYRYMWDGHCSAAGVLPSKYSPLEVRLADSNSQLPADLSKLVELRNADPQLGEILNRVHYPQYTTPYPPVSQVVFLLSAWTSPHRSIIPARVLILKAWLLLFDVGTIGIVWWMIRQCGLRDGWLVAYAWCPLVIKEIANSAHLDAIAVFFVTAGVALSWNAGFFASGRRLWLTCCVGAVLIALGIGAKLYGVVLIPILCWMFLRRHGVATAATFFAICVFLTGLLLSPMYGPGSAAQPRRQFGEEQVNRGDGLQAFLSTWRMNDLAFSLIQENIEPPRDDPKAPTPWFVLVPDQVRSQIFSVIDGRWQTSTFVVTRIICGIVFCLVGLWLLLRKESAQSPTGFLESAFLTLAFFWFFLPTLNPWYWLWAMPLVCFARNRAWLWVSGFLFLYYTRFWFLYHASNEGFFGTPYRGQDFFHYVVVWFEHGPVLVAIASVAVWRFRRKDSAAG